MISDNKCRKMGFLVSTLIELRVLQRESGLIEAEGDFLVASDIRVQSKPEERVSIHCNKKHLKSVS